MNNKKQQYLETYYKNLCEELMEKISLLEKSLIKRKKNAASKKLDPVGKEDADIDNDGKPNTKADNYLKNRRKARSAAIGGVVGCASNVVPGRSVLADLPVGCHRERVRLGVDDDERGESAVDHATSWAPDADARACFCSASDVSVEVARRSGRERDAFAVHGLLLLAQAERTETTKRLSARPNAAYMSHTTSTCSP